MYKNFVTFSKLCECPQSLVRVLASPIPCLPKLNPVSQGFHSTCSSNSSRGNTVVKNLVANHLTSKINNKNSSNQFYCQTRRQHVYFPMQRPNWGGSFSSPADSHRCYFSTSVPEVLEGTRPIQFWGHETVSCIFNYSPRLHRFFLGGGGVFTLLIDVSVNIRWFKFFYKYPRIKKKKKSVFWIL